jgi:hypothetical protein
MIRRTIILTIVAYSFVGILSLSAEPANAAGFVRTLCWAGTHSPGASPTVGCTVQWEPGGVGVYGYFLGSYPVCSPNCVIQPNNGSWVYYFDMVRTPTGTHKEYLPYNCVGQVVTVTVVSLTEATRPTQDENGRRGEEQTVQRHERDISGPVGQHCV